MANEVRSGVLRGARTSSEMTGQDTRLAGNRMEHVSRGSYINYYDDLGVSTTEDAAIGIRKSEKEYNTRVSEAQGRIDAENARIQAEYEKSRQQLEEQRPENINVEGVLNEAWEVYTTGDRGSTGWRNPYTNELVSADEVPAGYEEYWQDWFRDKPTTTTVRITGSEHAGDREYTVPWEQATGFLGGGLNTTWTNNESYATVDTHTRGQNIGQQLENGLSQMEAAYRGGFEEAAMPYIERGIDTVNRNKQIFGEAEGVLESSYTNASGSLAGSQSQLNAAKAQHDNEWALVRENYAKKKDTIQNIFSQFKVEEVA